MQQRREQRARARRLDARRGAVRAQRRRQRRGACGPQRSAGLRLRVAVVRQQRGQRCLRGLRARRGVGVGGGRPARQTAAPGASLPRQQA
jgi:hypothetical protein